MPTTGYWASSPKTKPSTLPRRKQPKTPSARVGRPRSRCPTCGRRRGCYGRKRVVWLLVLFAAEAYTGSVLRAFSDEMEAVIALAFFIPLLIGTGGNTGTQIATTLVRAMATGQVRFRDVPAVLAKELSTGVLVGLTMAAAAVVRAWTLGVGPQVTLTVALTVAAIVVWSSLVAAVLPPLLKKLRIDPAIVSGPMIATIVDGTGLLIYFLVAHLTLTELHGL